jgi:hypothetical protein
MRGQATEEDRLFFATAHRILKPEGYMVWGNAIPDSTWKPCFDCLESLGLKLVEVCDVTREAVLARDLDKSRVDAFMDQCFSQPRHQLVPEYDRRQGHLQGSPIPKDEYKPMILVL